MITKKEVGHIAHLARIELAEEEKTSLINELSAILDFVAKLNEVDTSRALPLTGGTELVNEVRADEQLDTSVETKQAEMLASAPDKKEEWIKVRAIFE